MENKSKEIITSELYYSSMNNIKENIKEFRNDFLLFSQDIKNENKNIKETAIETLLQATKTNGRATALEEWSKEATKLIENNIKEINTLKNYRWWFIGFGVSLSFLGFFALQNIVNTAIENKNIDLDKRISIMVEKTLEEKFNIEQINE